MRIDRRRERLPLCLRKTHELRLGSVARNALVEPTDLEAQDQKVSEKKEKQADVGRGANQQAFAPFLLRGELSATCLPAFRQQIQVRFGGGNFNRDQLGTRREDPFHRVAEFVETFRQQNPRGGSIDAL